MSLIKLTSKRQATFPAELCRQLGVGPGDSLILEAVDHDSEAVWILKPAHRERPSWFGRLKHYSRKSSEPWSRERHGDAVERAMVEDGRQ